MKNQRISGAAFCAALCFAGTACLQAQTPPPKADPFETLRGTLQLNKTPHRADCVTFTYSVKNTGKTPQSVPFGSTQRFDVLVTQNNRTWQLSQTVLPFYYGISLKKVTFAPGQSKTFSATVRAQDMAIRPGSEWTAVAYLTPMKTRAGGFLSPPNAPPSPADRSAMATFVSEQSRTK